MSEIEYKCSLCHKELPIKNNEGLNEPFYSFELKTETYTEFKVTDKFLFCKEDFEIARNEFGAILDINRRY